MSVDYQPNLKLPELYNLALNRALTAVGIFVEGEAVENITNNRNVDTGRLRASINYQVKRDAEKGVCQIGTNVEYGFFIEYGTGIYAESGLGRKTPWSYQRSDGRWITTAGFTPSPFLRPALDDNIEKIKKIIAGEYRQVFK
jgi:HK97 gp10 family phage protein